MRIRSICAVGMVASALVACAARGTTQASGQTPADATTITRGDTTLVAGAIGARLDEYLSRATRFGFAGSVLVADSTHVLLRKGYGLADQARGTPITTRTLFDMGSIVKQFTAAAILLLESERRLSVRDSIGKYFPNVPADKAGITLHHLLTHSSGLVDPPIGGYDPVGRDSLVTATLAEPLGAPIGRQFIYSNAGFSLLAAIIERVTGQQYERFMRDRLFVPTGMLETGYTIPKWDPARVAHTYTPPVDHDTPLARLVASGGPQWMLMGNGGLLTTTGDMYRWELGLKAGTPISRALQAKQFAPQFDRGAMLAQGYDWWLERTEGDKIMYHRGGDDPMSGVNAEYRRYPSDGTTIILLASTRHNGASTRRFAVPALRRLVTGDRPPSLPSVAPGTAASLARYAGVYTLDSTSRVTVTVERDHLALGADGQNAVDLLVFNRDTASLRVRRELNARGAALVDALAGGPLDGLLAFFPGDSAAAQRMRGYWADAERKHGAFRGREVLGTARLDRGTHVTTMRVAFARETVTVRCGWSQVRPIADSDDVMLERFTGPVRYSPVTSAWVSWYWWPAGAADEITTYDLLTERELRADFGRDANGAINTLVVHAPEGDVVLRRRVK